MDGNCFKSDSKIWHNGCGERLHNEVDRISELPDDIVVVILSFLSLSEAVTTSVLSSRWSELWKHIPKLVFNPKDLYPSDEESWDPKRSNYIERVNSVLQSHKALFLKKIKIHGYVNKSAQCTVSKWLEFVFSRQVERLELYFSCREAVYRIVLQELLRESRICWDRNLIIFRSLKSLFLGSFQVSGEDVMFLLRKLRFLEKLIIYRSTLTSDVEVCGADLMLKHLQILSCRGEKTIKVSAPNLTRLSFDFESSKLLVENVPKLVDLSFTSLATEQCFASVASSCISQLESLELTLWHPKVFLANGFPKMANLKKLVITYFYEHDMLPINALLWASPHLQEFELSLLCKCEIPTSFIEVTTNVEETPHRHLKVFEFEGFCWDVADHVELVIYISNNCLKLEKIIIDCASMFPTTTVSEDVKDWLQGRIPDHTQLLFH